MNEFKKMQKLAGLLVENQFKSDRERIREILLNEEFEDSEDFITEEDSEEFTPQGYYGVSNAGGYEIMLNPDDNDFAKIREPNGEITDWLPIEYDYNEEGELVAILDPMGYKIPFDEIMDIGSVNEEYDVDEAKKDKKPEPKNPLPKPKKDDDFMGEEDPLDGEEDLGSGISTGGGNGTKEVQTHLEAALKSARSLGDKKLIDQIGNTITFFTRTHVVKDGSEEGDLGRPLFSKKEEPGTEFNIKEFLRKNH